MDIHLTQIDTPLGCMVACATEQGVCLLEFDNRKNIESQFGRLTKALNGVLVEKENTYFNLLRTELQNYFKGENKEFTVPLHFIGTDFQRKVWNELIKIPFGITISYLDLAKKIGDPKAVRAVANSNALNKIAIIVPCHRVIGSNGKLTGYAGGLDKKKWLLNLEQSQNNLFSKNIIQ